MQTNLWILGASASPGSIRSAVLPGGVDRGALYKMDGDDFAALMRRETAFVLVPCLHGKLTYLIIFERRAGQAAIGGF